MNAGKFFLAPGAITVLAVATAFAQAVGDYGTAGTGRWGTTGANWVVCQSAGTWAGATPAPGAPTATTNVWIRAGHSDTVEASGKECANLTVEATGLLVGNLPLPSSTIQYLQVHGTTVTVNGILGSSLSPGTNLALEPATSASTLTLTGSGTFGPARIRVSSDASGVTVVFDINTTLRYTGSTGTGGVALYPQTDNNVFTVNAGKTVTCVVNAGLGASPSNRALASVDLTMNVYGTINMNSSASPMTLRASSGKTVTLTVHPGGTVSVLGGVHTSTAADGGSTVITDNGSMTVGGPVDFSNPSFTVTGSGTFTLYQTGQLMIGHPSGIASAGASGQIQTTTRSFSPLAKYVYLGTAAQGTGTGLPSTVGDLQIDNTSGLTLTNGVTVSDSLILTGGTIVTGANTLAMASTGTVDRSDGYVVGNLQKNVATGSGVARTFEIGTATNYVPLTVTFATVTTAGNLTASTTTGDHPNLASGTINPAKSVNRYWTLANSAIGFDSFGAEFDFLPSELDAGSSPGVFIAERYSGGVWSGLTEGQRTSTSTAITGATGFGDFAIGEDETAAPAPAFELTSSSLNLGAVRLTTSRTDSAYVRNIGSATMNISSITSSSAPVFTVAPAGAVIPSHDSALVTVTFSPSATGAAQANIVFAHDAFGTPDTLRASGYGTIGAVQSNGTGGGDWGLAGTWQGGLIPTTYDSVIVLASDSVSVLADTSCAALELRPGGRIGLYAALTVGGGAIAGTMTARSQGVFVVDDTCSFEGTGIYDHARNSGDFPNHVRWLTGSTAKFTGIQDTVPDNSSQNFHHVVWDCPSQAGANLNTGWDSITIGGDITVVSTGGGRWQMAGPVTNDSSTITIMGNIYQSAGNFTTNGTGNAGTRVTIHHYGNINVTGGNFSVSRGSQGGTGTTRWYLYDGDFSMANATTQNSNAAGARFVFARAGTQALLLGSGNTLTALPFEVAGGTTLNAGVSVVRGSGMVMVDAGATVRSAQSGGFDSTFAGTGTRLLDPASNYVLDGAVPQVTGRRMADTLNALTINNAAGVLLSDSILVDGTLSVTAGDLDLNGKRITLGPSALLSETTGNTVTGTGGTIGTVRTLNAPSVATDIAGLGVMIGSGANLGSTAIDRGHAVQNIPGRYGIERYFDLTPANNTGLNATLKFHYDDSEMGNAYEPTLELQKSTDAGATWSAAGGTLNTGSNLIEVSGLDALSRWTAAGDFGVSVAVSPGWNMISNPVTAPNDSVLRIFPTSAFPYAFGFNPSGGYQQQYHLLNGAGYWGKFTSGTTQGIVGAIRTLDTAEVAVGWNMIGSISQPVDTAAIVEVPAGIITSRYFGYALGYSEAAVITPGKGYWVKSSAVGQLVLSGSAPARPAVATENPLEEFAAITLTDRAGASQTLWIGRELGGGATVESYELPPQGPDGAFDARFASGRSVELVDVHRGSRHTIALQAASCPVTVSWNVGGTLKLRLHTGDGVGEEMRGEGSAIVAAPPAAGLVITSQGVDIPRDYALGQNYPNPFNPATTVRIAIPQQSSVTLSVYNILGQLVARVVDGILEAGYHDVTWNATATGGMSVGTGVYFYRLEAASLADGRTYSDVRKMILMK